MKKTFLTDNEGNKSMMRLAMLCVIIMAAILFLAMAGYIVISAIKSGSINWGGMAALVGALSAFIGTLVIGKANQKVKELKSVQPKEIEKENYYKKNDNVNIVD